MFYIRTKDVEIFEIVCLALVDFFKFVSFVVSMWNICVQCVVCVLFFFLWSLANVIYMEYGKNLYCLFRCQCWNVWNYGFSECRLRESKMKVWLSLGCSSFFKRTFATVLRLSLCWSYFLTHGLCLMKNPRPSCVKVFVCKCVCVFG